MRRLICDERVSDREIQRNLKQVGQCALLLDSKNCFAQPYGAPEVVHANSIPADIRERQNC